MDDAVRVLQVDGDGDLAPRVAAALEADDERLEVVTAPNAAVGRERLESDRFDCVVSAQSLPDAHWAEFFEDARELAEGTPFLLYGTAMGNGVAAEALERGVTAYVPMDEGNSGVPVLRNHILTHVEQRRRLGFYEAISEETADVLTVLDSDGLITWVSPSVERVLGYDPAALSGDDPLSYVHPDDGEGFEAALQTLEADGVETAESEHRWQAADGSWRWLETAIRDRTETVIDGYVLTSRDVTDRKQREQELERRERILEELGDTIYALDEHSNYDYVNPAGKRISGFEHEEIVEKGPELLHPAEDLERFEAVIRELIADDERRVETVEATLLTAEGDEIPIEVSLTALQEDGEFQGTVGVVRDITERKERERELLEYETIIQALPDEVAILDTEGFMTRVIPPTGQELTTTGYEVDELEGEHVAKVMPDEHVETGVELIEELVTTDKERVSFEMELIHKDGRLLEREDHLALVRDPDDGSIVGTVGVLRDIAERKAYERALEAQNERLEEFASIVSHDLRNPLNVAKGRVDLAHEETGSDHLETALESIDRMETLIQDLLTLAREGDDISEIEPVSLSTLASECWGHVSAPEATVEIDAEGLVCADGTRLQQLVENLYRNAIEHGGESVTIRVESIDDGFAVADDGPGIPSEKREQVFETGYTGSEDGTGFGLAIVERIVDAHGWEIDVTESEAGGARFEITGVARPPCE